MSVVLFGCPATGKSIDIGLETDQLSIDKVADTAIQVHCPHCGSQHKFEMSEARLKEHRMANRRQRIGQLASL